jgi:hypothetical protein
MAKKNKERTSQATSSSENSEDTVTQTMADLTISGDLPYRPRAASGSPALGPSPSNHEPPQQQNIVHVFAAYFGDENDLRNWQRLCRDLGITEELNSKTQCRKVRFSASLTPNSRHNQFIYNRHSSLSGSTSTTSYASEIQGRSVSTSRVSVHLPLIQ